MAESSELCEYPSKHFEWKIPKFFDLPKVLGYFLESPWFDLTGAKEKWYFQIYTSDWICLILFKEISEAEHRVAFRMGIKRVDGSVFKMKEVFERDEKFGMHEDYWGLRLIERSTLQRFRNSVAPDGTLTVFCTATIVDEALVASATGGATPSSITGTVKGVSQSPLSVKTVESACRTKLLDDISNLSKCLEDLYFSKRFTDVTVQVKSREFLAHRNILASRSAVFTSMFLHDTEEKKNGRIEIPDCDPDTFEDFLLFLYTRKLDCVTSTNAVSLYETAEKYDVQILKEECVRCMTHTLTVDTFCDVLYLATMYNESELLKATTDFFNSNTKNILITPKWHTFISENPLLGNELFLQTFT